jgi:uncharacterized protein
VLRRYISNDRLPYGNSTASQLDLPATIGKADGEGFELPPHSPGNTPNSNPRGTNPTRARNKHTSGLDLPIEIAQLITLCQRLNQEAVARVLNFAKFEFSTVALATSAVPLRCPSDRIG